jgi:RNA-directed DNA polymerase
MPGRVGRRGGGVVVMVARAAAGPAGALYVTLNGPRARRGWILDADLSAAFDRIDHTRLLDALGSSPPGEWSSGG